MSSEILEKLKWRYACKKFDTTKKLSEENLIQLRVLDGVGCEKFATYVYNYINNIIFMETKGRVKVLTVECFEGGTNNSAIYKPKTK